VGDVLPFGGLGGALSSADPQPFRPEPVLLAAAVEVAGMQRYTVAHLPAPVRVSFSRRAGWVRVAERGPDTNIVERESGAPSVEELIRRLSCIYSVAEAAARALVSFLDRSPGDPVVIDANRLRDWQSLSAHPK
jgi:hypothetical protein